MLIFLFYWRLRLGSGKGNDQEVGSNTRIQRLINLENTSTFYVLNIHERKKLHVIKYSNDEINNKRCAHCAIANKIKIDNVIFLLRKVNICVIYFFHFHFKICIWKIHLKKNDDCVVTQKFFIPKLSC
jgi:hypothetical protein